MDISSILLPALEALSKPYVGTVTAFLPPLCTLPAVQLSGASCSLERLQSSQLPTLIRLG